MAADNNSLMPEKKDDRKKDLVQFSGVVSVKKKKETGFWNWLARMFFSGRKPKDIAMDVLEHEVVPNIQDGVYNSLVSILGKTIYKENQKVGGGYSSSTPGSFITNYVSYGDKKKQQAAALETTKQKEEETVKSGFENPAFTNEKEARDFLNEMKNYVTKYEQMSVHDLAWMQKKIIDYTWEKYGFDKEQILAIQGPSRFVPPMIVEDGNGNKIRLTHYIDMPKAHEL